MPHDDELPELDSSPLPPPTGAFEAVAASARRRRQRTVGLVSGGTALALAAVLGGALALGGSGTGSAGGEALEVASATPTVDTSQTPTEDPSPTATATPTATSVVSASVSPTAAPASPSSPSSAASSPPSLAPTSPPAPPCLPFAGRAVDDAGRPLAGIHVVEIYEDNGIAYADQVTGADGLFTAGTRGGSVLAPTGLGSSLQTASTPNLERALVGKPLTKPGCADLDSEGRAVRTDVVLHEGGTLEGRFTYPDDAAPDAYRPDDMLYTAGSSVSDAYSLFPIRVKTTSTGFRITGLPTTTTGALNAWVCFAQRGSVTTVAGQTRAYDFLVEPSDNDPSTPGLQYLDAGPEFTACTEHPRRVPPATASPTAAP